MERKFPKIYSGSKFYRYLDGQEHPDIIRLLNIDYDKGIAKYLDGNGNKKKDSYKFITDNFKMLAPDGLINFSHVVMPDGNEDIIVALKAFPKTDAECENMSNLPYAICRQMAADVFASSFNPDDPIIGVSISQDSCTANVDFNLMLSCIGLKYSRMVAVYLDDTLDKILSLFDNNIFNKVFETVIYPRWQDTKGACISLEELLRTNNFMYDFRKCFGIKELPFAIDQSDIETEQLDELNINFLANELKTTISETYLVRYARDIDFSKFKRKYVLVSSADNGFSEVFVVGYDEV
jgi:hypothetical protein